MKKIMENEQKSTNAVDTIDSKTFVINGQLRNQFIHAPAPFFSIPAWWRRFIFRILTPRDFIIYSYLCSLCGPQATAFPTHEQIAYEMGLDSTDVVVKSLKRLEDYGFFMRDVMAIPGRQTSLRRTVYQRPAPEYTLLKLLELNKIDGKLFPVSKNAEVLMSEQDTTEAAVNAGLRNLLKHRFPTDYTAAKNPKKSLRSALEAQLQERVGRSYADLVGRSLVD